MDDCAIAVGFTLRTERTWKIVHSALEALLQRYMDNTLSSGAGRVVGGIEIPVEKKGEKSGK